MRGTTLDMRRMQLPGTMDWPPPPTLSLPYELFRILGESAVLYITPNTTLSSKLSSSFCSSHVWETVLFHWSFP